MTYEKFFQNKYSDNYFWHTYIDKRIKEDMHTNLYNLLSLNYLMSPAKINRVFYTLYSSMEAPYLYYHVPSHVLSMLEFAQDNDIKLTEWEELAIYFHDAIYDPDPKYSKSNELNSANFMRSLLYPYLTTNENDKKDLDLAYRAIVATSFHLLDNDSIDKRFHKLLDLDLSNICSELIHVEAANKLVRKEIMKGNNFNEEQAFEGQKKFMKQLLERDTHLYRTQWFRDNCEEKARENLNKIFDL